MKTTGTFKGMAGLLILAPALFSAPQSCKSSDPFQALHKGLLEHADGIRVIDTHEHQRDPESYGIDSTDIHFYHLLHATYLMHDVVSAGASRVELESFRDLSLNRGWELYGPYLEFSRASSYYGHFVKGFELLYDFDELYFTESNTRELSRQITANYRDYGAWFDKAFDAAGFELMLVDRYWNTLDPITKNPRTALVFNINLLVYQVSYQPSARQLADRPPNNMYVQAMDAGQSMESLDDYLAFCSGLMEQFVENGAVGLKNSLAYGRSLNFEKVSREEASGLYARRSEGLSFKDRKRLQDFTFRWIVEESIRQDLPIQIHTGYLAGNGNYLENSHPLKLLPLFMDYPQATFILFHGGYPWTSEFIAMGKMFPHVYLDLVWLPQISRQKAVAALDEMLDAVPYNKIFWGGDCAFIEEAAGSLEFGKSVVAETLARRILRGLLDQEVARDIIQAIFRDNAMEVFQLEEKLGLGAS